MSDLFIFFLLSCQCFQVSIPCSCGSSVSLVHDACGKGILAPHGHWLETGYSLAQRLVHLGTSGLERFVK